MNQATEITQQLAVGPEDAARMAGISRSAIYLAQANGELKGFKIGRRRLFMVEDLKTWITSKRESK